MEKEVSTFANGKHMKSAHIKISKTFFGIFAIIIIIISSISIVRKAPTWHGHRPPGIIVE
jgi:hypothetical protein